MQTSRQRQVVDIGDDKVTIVHEIQNHLKTGGIGHLIESIFNSIFKWHFFISFFEYDCIASQKGTNTNNFFEV